MLSLELSTVTVETAPPNRLAIIKNPITVNPTLQPTCVAVREVGRDDLVLGAIWEFLEPGDLHHLLPILHLIATGEPGLTLRQGALGGDGVRWVHKGTLHTDHCRD